MGAALPFITVAAMGANAIGSIVQGQQQAAADKANAQIAENNSTVALQNASFAAQEGNSNAEAQGLKNRAEAGSLLASQGASGVDINSESSTSTRNSQDLLGNLDVATIRSNAARQAYGYETQSTSFKNQSAIDNSSAKNAITSSYINAASSLLKQGSSSTENGSFGSFTNSNSLNSESLSQTGPYDNSLPWRNNPVGA